MLPSQLPENVWVPFDLSAYRLDALLTEAEKTALATAHSRGRLLRMKPAPEFIRPLKDIAAESGCSREVADLIILDLLREMHLSVCRTGSGRRNAGRHSAGRTEKDDR